MFLKSYGTKLWKTTLLLPIFSKKKERRKLPIDPMSLNLLLLDTDQRKTLI